MTARTSDTLPFVPMESRIPPGFGIAASSPSPSDPRPQARELDGAGLERAIQPHLSPRGAQACARWLELSLYQRGALRPDELAGAGGRWRGAVERALRVE